MMNILKKLSQCHDLIIMLVLFAVAMNLLVAAIRYSKNPFTIEILTIFVIVMLPVTGAGYLAWTNLRKPKQEKPDPYAALNNFPEHLEK